MWDTLVNYMTIVCSSWAITKKLQTRSLFELKSSFYQIKLIFQQLNYLTDVLFQKSFLRFTRRNANIYVHGQE